MDDILELHFDASEFDWHTFWTLQVQEKYPEVESLEKVHHCVTPQKLDEILAYCVEICKTPEFHRMVDQYYHSILQDLLPADWMIQTVFNVRTSSPECAKLGKTVNFHCDGWTGNGTDIRTVWTPITESFGNNSLWCSDSEQSHAVTKSMITEQWDHVKIHEQCSAICKPVDIQPGSCLIFPTHLIHGGVYNDTDHTRWSMDGRILLKGGSYGRKTPGGYFRFPGTSTEQHNLKLPDISWGIYASECSKYSAEIAQGIQRNTIKSLIQSHNLNIVHYGLYDSDGFTWMPFLREVADADHGVQGILMLSVFCLPDNDVIRNKFLSDIVQNNKKIYFVNERFLFQTDIDLEYVNKLYEYN